METMPQKVDLHRVWIAGSGSGMGGERARIRLFSAGKEVARIRFVSESRTVPKDRKVSDGVIEMFLPEHMISPTLVTLGQDRVYIDFRHDRAFLYTTLPAAAV
jgi:hypothetical protein